MRQRMVIENLSPRTITSYLNGPKRLIEYCGKPPRQISTDEIYSFLVYEKEVKKHSRSTMRINVNGIRYLYKNFLNRPEIVDEVPYPKQEKYIPEIFTGQELKRLFGRNTCIHCTKTDGLFLPSVLSVRVKRPWNIWAGMSTKWPSATAVSNPSTTSTLLSHGSITGLPSQVKWFLKARSLSVAGACISCQKVS